MCHIEFKTNKLHFNTSLSLVGRFASNGDRLTLLRLALVYVTIWNALRKWHCCNARKNAIYRNYVLWSKFMTTCWFLVNSFFSFAFFRKNIYYSISLRGEMNLFAFRVKPFCHSPAAYVCCAFIRCNQATYVVDSQWICSGKNWMKYFGQKKMLLRKTCSILSWWL